MSRQFNLTLALTLSLLGLGVHSTASATDLHHLNPTGGKVGSASASRARNSPWGHSVRMGRIRAARFLGIHIPGTGDDQGGGGNQRQSVLDATSKHILAAETYLLAAETAQYNKGRGDLEVARANAKGALTVLESSALGNLLNDPQIVNQRNNANSAYIRADTAIKNLP